MKFNMEKSGAIILKNPNIILLLVIYLLIAATLLPLVVLSYSKGVIFYIFSILVFLFTCAFFAGWFGMIKAVIQYKEAPNPIEDIQKRHKAYKEGFFASIPVHILPLIFYVLLIIGFMWVLFYAADYLFGKPYDVINGIAALKNDLDAIMNFISTLPKEVIDTIKRRSLFLYSGFVVYLLLTLYSVPALYFNKSKNPLIGLKNGFLAFIKKPAGSFVLFLALALAHIFLIFFEAVSVINSVLMFIAMILRVYFTAYMVVLIFEVYETNFTADCNNRPDSLGEDKTCS